MRRRDGLWVLVALLLGWAWLQARDARIRTEALAEARADSAAAAIAELGRRHRARDARRGVLERLSAARAESLATLRRELGRLQTSATTVGAALLDHAERDTLVSDSLRGLIRLTLGIMDRQAEGCSAALASCDSIIAGKDRVIATLDSTRAEFHEALHRTTDLWQAAERRARPGLFRRLEVALPWMAGAFLVGALLTR